MDQPQEELDQMATWFSEEGLAPDSPKETQLTLLWCSYQRSKSHLNHLARDLEIQRSQHLTEMGEVRKSLEQIRIFTEHKDVLAQEIQDENDQLKHQLQRLIALQDAQVSEVAKMLYQQGLTELIHSSCSEQVAYLLVERASLLEMTDITAKLRCDGNTANPWGSDRPMPKNIECQSAHKGALHHSQSPWKKLFGLHKASQSKCTFMPTEARQFTGQISSVEKEFFRLERDLEEGSRRLAMAHSEIRRLTEELESAHLTQRAFEPELQAAQQEVEQLRQEVEKLKKYEIVELRKAKEMNDRLDLEIRALRNRVRSLDAEKTSLQQSVVCMQREVKQLKLALQKQQLQNVQIKAIQAKELAEECPNYEEAVKTVLTPEDDYSALKKEICETLKCLDTERSKYHDMKEKHMAKLCRAKQKLDDETTWRDEKIKCLERELSLCSHSLAKEKEIVARITEENEKLLVEKRTLLHDLNEEEHSKKESNLTASLSKCRVDFLETENKKLVTKILNLTNQLAVLERTLQSHHISEGPKKVHNPHQVFSVPSLQTSDAMMPEPSEIGTLLDDTWSSHTKQAHLSPTPKSCVSAGLSRSSEMGYINLTSTQNFSSSPAALSSSESPVCV